MIENYKVNVKIESRTVKMIAKIISLKFRLCSKHSKIIKKNSFQEYEIFVVLGLASTANKPHLTIVVVIPG